MSCRAPRTSRHGQQRIPMREAPSWLRGRRPEASANSPCGDDARSGADHSRHGCQPLRQRPGSSPPCPPVRLLRRIPARRALGDSSRLRGPLAIHAALGLALIAIAIGVSVRSFAVPRSPAIACSALAALLMIGAGFNGASFLDFANNISSLLMALLAFGRFELLRRLPAPYALSRLRNSQRVALTSALDEREQCPSRAS